MQSGEQIKELKFNSRVQNLQFDGLFKSLDVDIEDYTKEEFESLPEQAKYEKLLKLQEFYPIIKKEKLADIENQSSELIFLAGNTQQTPLANDSSCKPFLTE